MGAGKRCLLCAGKLRGRYGLRDACGFWDGAGAAQPGNRFEEACTDTFPSPVHLWGVEGVGGLLWSVSERFPLWVWGLRGQANGLQIRNACYWKNSGGRQKAGSPGNAGRFSGNADRRGLRAGDRGGRHRLWHDSGEGRDGGLSGGGHEGPGGDKGGFLCGACACGGRRAGGSAVRCGRGGWCVGEWTGRCGRGFGGRRAGGGQCLSRLGDSLDCGVERRPWQLLSGGRRADYCGYGQPSVWKRREDGSGRGA